MKTILNIIFLIPGLIVFRILSLIFYLFIILLVALSSLWFPQDPKYNHD